MTEQLFTREQVNEILDSMLWRVRERATFHDHNPDVYERLADEFGFKDFDKAVIGGEKTFRPPHKVFDASSTQPSSNENPLDKFIERMGERLGAHDLTEAEQDEWDELTGNVPSTVASASRRLNPKIRVSLQHMFEEHYMPNKKTGELNTSWKAYSIWLTLTELFDEGSRSASIYSLLRWFDSHEPDLGEKPIISLVSSEGNKEKIRQVMLKSCI